MATPATNTPKARKSRKTLDLATAHVTDGALAAPRSLYDIIGQTRSSYDTRDFSVYRARIQAMELFQLQQHAKDLGVLPSHTKELTIRRLEEAFLKENNQTRKTQARTEALTPEQALKQRAEAIMRREA